MSCVIQPINIADITKVGDSISFRNDCLTGPTKKASIHSTHEESSQLMAWIAAYPVGPVLDHDPSQHRQNFIQEVPSCLGTVAALLCSPPCHLWKNSKSHFFLSVWQGNFHKYISFSLGAPAGC
jgi:hypothetical protein